MHRGSISRWVKAACVAWGLACAPVSAAVIDVQSAGRTVEGLIRLGDVARIDDADPQLSRQLSAVTLGPAPAPGRKLRISQQMIRDRLLVHGINLTDVEFAGQSFVILESPAAPVETPAPKPAPVAAKPVAVRPWAPSTPQKAQAVKHVQTAFHRQYQSGSSDIGPLRLAVEIADKDVLSLTHIDPDRIHFAEAGLEWGGPQTLTARIPAADGATQVIRMQAWLNETPNIITVKHAIPKGQVLTEADLVTKPAAEGETGIELAQQLVGREATKPLRPGTALQHGDVADRQLVRNNDLVTVRAKARGLTVSRVFKAQSGGAAGEVINLVALEDPREKVQAVVTGWHEAEIASPDAVREAPSDQPAQFPTRRSLSSAMEPSRSGGLR